MMIATPNQLTMASARDMLLRRANANGNVNAKNMKDASTHLQETKGKDLRGKIIIDLL